MKSENVNKYRYVILGAGRSGMGIAKLLTKKGAKVFLSDSSTDEKLLYLSKKDLLSSGVEFETGLHSEKIYDCDIIVKSPGIPPHSEIILKAKEKGIQIVSEIEVAYWFCPCPVIAITGTNGKTTTTVLTGEIFRNAGFDVKVCGNVGLAFSEVIESLNEKSVVVLETSSFQLFDIINFRPKVSALLNLTSDHIDWHGSMENYLDAKLKINYNQIENDDFMYNYDDIYLRIALKNRKIFGNANVFGFDYENILSDNTAGCYVRDSGIIYFDKNKNISELISGTDDIGLKGRHNVYNSMASVISAKKFGIENNIIAGTLKEFKGVEHRIEFVRSVNGIEFYNDSKATNYDSTYVALESFPGNIVLILGGKNGDHNFPLIENFVKDRVKFIVAIGQTKENIKEYFSKFKEVVVCKTMSDAVKKSFKKAEAGDIILLSPAYKSFDMFDNFEHRGSEFKKSVNSL